MLYSSTVMCPYCKKDNEEFPGRTLSALRASGARHTTTCPCCEREFHLRWHAASRQFCIERTRCQGGHRFYTRTTDISPRMAQIWNESGFMGCRRWQAESVHEHLCRDCDLREIETTRYGARPSWFRCLTSTHPEEELQ